MSLEKECVPFTPSLQYCIECGLKPKNVPIENDNCKAHNDEVNRIYLEKMSIWSDYEERKKTDPNARKPMGMNRKPQMGRFLEPIVMCMCSTSSCVMEGSDISSTCPIKCINPDTGKRYPFIGSGNRRYCSCPIC